MAQICHVECVSASRLYWPALDLDLTVEAIRNPMAASYLGASFDC